MHKFHYYLKIWLICLHISNRSASIYGFDYFLRIVRAIVDIGVAFIVLFVIYSESPEIAGWNQSQSLLVLGVFQLVWSTNYLLFGGGFDQLFWYLIQGELDYYLTKPTDAQFLVSVHVSYITNLFRVCFALSLIIYTLLSSQTPLTPFSLILGFITLISAICIYYSFIFTSSVLAFWTFSGELSQLSNTIATTARFPTDYYGKFTKNLMLIVPLAFISTVPANTFLGKNQFIAVLSPLIAVISLILTRKLWLNGLRSYSSASS